MGGVLARAARAASRLLGAARPYAALPSSRASAPLVVVGLGNPGAEYEHTRHNVGFMAVEQLKRESDGVQGADSRQDGALVSRCSIRGVPAVLAKPQSFMNLSGGPISRVLSRQGAGADRLVLVYDDLDTPLGRVRVRATGGAGGHNGVKSTLQALSGGGRRGGGGAARAAGDPSSARFARVKIGIGRPPGSMDVADYVLSGFRAAERELLQLSLQEAADAVRAVAELGLDRAVSGARVAADGSKYVAEGGKKEKNKGGTKQPQQQKKKEKKEKKEGGADAAGSTEGRDAQAAKGSEPQDSAASPPSASASTLPAASSSAPPAASASAPASPLAPLPPGLERKPAPSASSPLPPGLERKRKAENGAEEGHDAKRSEN